MLLAVSDQSRAQWSAHLDEYDRHGMAWSPGATSASWERPSTPAEEAEHFDLAKDDSTTSLQDPEIYPLVEGARDPLHPPPGRAPDLSTVQVREPEKADEDLRQQNTAGLTKLLLGLDRRGGGSASGDDGRSSVFPWWGSGQSKQATHQTYTCAPEFATVRLVCSLIRELMTTSLAKVRCCRWPPRSTARSTTRS